MKIPNFKESWWWHLIGPLAVIIAIVLAGPVKVWQVLANAKPGFIAAAAVMAIPIIIAKSLRWQLLLRSYSIKLGFAESTYMYSTAMVLSAVTPGKLGDMIKIVMLIKKGFSAAKAMASNVIDRCFDLAFVLLIGYFSMLFFSGKFTKQLHIINLIGLLLFGAWLLFIFKKHLLKKIFLKLIPAKYHAQAKQTWMEITDTFQKDKIVLLLGVVLWTLVHWFVYFFSIYLCSRAVNLEIPFIYMTGCAAVGTFLSLLPITVAGIGTRDGVYILLLAPLGIQTQQALALSAMVLAVFLLNCVIFYLISLLFKQN